MPILLGGIFKPTGKQSPDEYFKGVRNKGDYHMVETRRFIDGVTALPYVSNLISRSTRSTDARRRSPRSTKGCSRKCPGGLSPHVGRAQKDGRSRGVREALTSSGIDGDKILARSQEPEVKARLVAKTQDAVERGAFGSPTFFVGDEMFFGKDQLRDVEEMYG